MYIIALIYFCILQLWDVRRKGCIFTYKGHSEVINSVQFSPDGKWVVSASSDSSIKVCDFIDAHALYYSTV